MITPKPTTPSAADETRAYNHATMRDRETCVMCGQTGVVQRDHRQNRTRNNTVVANIQCLCPRDHLWKTDHPKEAVAEGWAVPGYADPTDWPARRLFLTDNGAHILGWCMYLVDGRVEEISAAEAARRIRGGI